MIMGARGSHAVLLGTVSAMALAQVMGAGGAAAGSGPCRLDSSDPAQEYYACFGPPVAPPSGVPGVSYTFAGGKDLLVHVGMPITTSGDDAPGISASNLNGGLTLINWLNITTSGARSHGIYGQSQSGNIEIRSVGSIATAGSSSAFGIYATVVNWGDVTILLQAPISASHSAAGIVAYTPKGNIVISTDDVTVSGAHGIGITANTRQGELVVDARGNITAGGPAVDAVSGNGPASLSVQPGATLSSLGPTVVELRGTEASYIFNRGRIVGDVIFDGGVGSLFIQHAGSMFEPGSATNLGAATLNNAGTVSPGGTGTITTTRLTGNFVQTSTGAFKVDADWTAHGGAGAADKLAITGTAALAGTVIVNPVNFPTIGGLTKSFTVLTADGGITNNGISPANSSTVRYELLFPDANTMNLQATINFLGLGNLTSNQTGVGTNLNRILSGGTLLPFMPAMFTLQTNGQLGGALNQLAPIGDGGSFSTAMTTGGQFAQQLLSCRVAGEEGEVTRFIREGQCVWARVNARRLYNDGRADGVGYRENALFYSAGAQVKVAPDWRIGGGIGYETLNLSTDSSASSQGERLHLGGVVKYNPGPWLLAAGVTGGWGWHDNRRVVSFGGFGATATSSSGTSFTAARLTAAYLLSRGALYLKPQVELAATHLMRDSYRETGTGGIALAVAKASDTVLSASPSLELGLEQRGVDGFVTRAFVKGGVTFRDTDTFVTTATFAAAPGAPAFAITSRVDRTVADIGAGLDLISAGDTALRLQYDGQLSSRTTQHSGGAKLQLRF